MKFSRRATTTQVISTCSQVVWTSLRRRSWCLLSLTCTQVVWFAMSWSWTPRLQASGWSRTVVQSWLSFHRRQHVLLSWLSFHRRQLGWCTVCRLVPWWTFSVQQRWLCFHRRQHVRCTRWQQRREQRLWHGKPLPSSPQRLRRPPTRRRGQVRCSRRRQEQRHRPGLKPGGGRRGSGSLAAGSGSPGAGGGPPRVSNRGTCEDGGSSSAGGRCSSGL